jgi:mRNA interferase MazF
MLAGDLVRVDFGVPAGSEPGFVRPAVVVTADAVLEFEPRTIHVVPVTSNVVRDLPTEVAVVGSGLDEVSAAQCHLCSVISLERVLDQSGANVGAVVLAQIRAVLGDLLDLG